MSIVEAISSPSLQAVIMVASEAVVEFGASWCAPCRAFRPHFEKFSEAYPDVVCIYVDVDKDQQFVVDYEIQSVPQVMYFRNGEYVQHLTARSIIKLKEEYESL